MGWRHPGRAGGDLDQHVRVQPPSDALCRGTRRAAGQHPRRALESTSRHQGIPPRAAAAPEVRRSRTWRNRLSDGPFGPEHRVHLPALPAVRRDVRRAVPLHRADDITDATRWFSLGRRAESGHRVHIARHAVQRESQLLSHLLRGVRKRGRPRDHVDRPQRLERRPGRPAVERHREEPCPAAGGASARLGVRDPRRHEQREREPRIRCSGRGRTRRWGSRRSSGGEWRSSGPGFTWRRRR